MGASVRRRARAAATCALYVLFAPAFVLWFGLPVLWREYPSDLRHHARSVLRG